MVNLESPPHLVSNFNSLERLLATFGSEELQSRRRLAMDRFSEVGIPTHRDEEFKYLPLHLLSENSFQPAYGSTIYKEDLSGHVLNDLEALTLTFVNGEFAPELSNVSGHPEGVQLLSLAEALEQGNEKVLEHLGKVATLEGKLGSTNDERFVWLNTAFVSEGALIYVPKNVVVESLIHLRFINRPDHGSFVSHPRVLIVVEENAQAKVIETYNNLGGGLYFTNVVTEVTVGEGANLEHIRFQNESTEAVHIANVYSTQGKNSVFTSNNFAFGGAVSRVDINSYVGGEHAETWLNGAYLGQKKQIHDSHTRIDHAVPNCHSFEVYKGILDDQSVGVFNGKIFVYEDAQKTDAKQTNQGILLSPTATLNTKPQLEIFADDVKCTHGATIGQVREDAMFYLQSRGIPAPQAKALLVYAFAAEAIDKISVGTIREALEALLYARLEQ